MKVTLLNVTNDPEAMLIFSKRTRLSMSPEGFNDLADECGEMMDSLIPDPEHMETSEELESVFKTIGSAWEFVDFIFLIQGVTRAFTHELVRHRAGVAYAQQSQRAVSFEHGFEWLDTGTAKDNREYRVAMQKIGVLYNMLLDEGIAPQDARGILPTNILTNILFKVNLRSLSHICNVRLCFRAAGEFQDVVREMRRLVIEDYPWAHRILTVGCVMNSVCPWQNYEACPLKQKFPELRGLSDALKSAVEKEWEEMGTYSPQPVVKK